MMPSKNLKPTRGAELLTSWIKHSGISNLVVGARLGVGDATINRWRHGLAIPEQKNWSRLAELSSGAIPVESWREKPLESATREQRRSRRKRAVRARTVSVKRMTNREIEIGRLAYPEDTRPLRPKTRAECVGAPRPCPFVSCKYHLYLDVQARTGAIKLNFPDLEVEEMAVSCALDVADRGGATLEEAGAIMNLTRERIRQLEVRAMAKLDASREVETLRTFVDEGPVGKRHLPVLNKYEVDDENLPGFEEPDDDNEGEDADTDEESDEIDWGPPIPIDPLNQLGVTDLDDLADLIRSGR